MEREGGNGERIRKWRKREEIEREWGNVESQSLSISSFSLHFLLISSFSLHFLAARLQGCNDSCSPAICEHLWQIIFPLSSIFFLLYAAESSFKSSCRVLPQVFSSPLSLKSKAGKSSCTSVPQSIHLCARQIWKEAFSDSVKKEEEKQCWEPPMWIREMMNHLFCRFFKRRKFL